MMACLDHSSRLNQVLIYRYSKILNGLKHKYAKLNYEFAYFRVPVSNSGALKEEQEMCQYFHVAQRSMVWLMELMVSFENHKCYK